MQTKIQDVNTINLKLLHWIFKKENEIVILITIPLGTNQSDVNITLLSPEKLLIEWTMNEFNIFESSLTKKGFEMVYGSKPDMKLSQEVNISPYKAMKAKGIFIKDNYITVKLEELSQEKKQLEVQIITDNYDDIFN